MVDTTIVVPAVAGDGGAEASRSAVSWSAVIAGGVTAAAVAFILLILGAGLGLTTVSPWANAGATATSLGIGAIVWLIVTQWIAAGLGGYLTGRLRTKWVRVHTHEVFFRDTAHGFLSWALATVISAALLASAVSAVVGGTASTAATLIGGAAQGAAEGASQASGGSSPMAYFTDLLYRAPPAATPGAASGAATTPAPAASGAASTAGTPAPGAPMVRSPQDTHAESGRIMAAALAQGEISPADKSYLAQLIASETGLSQADAEKRVDDVMAEAKAAADKAKQAADVARKAAATLAFFSFLSLLIGAFIASAAAALGGRERDENEALYLR